jgi:hypothetical protein
VNVSSSFVLVGNVSFLDCRRRSCMSSRSPRIISWRTCSWLFGSAFATYGFGLACGACLEFDRRRFAGGRSLAACADGMFADGWFCGAAGSMIIIVLTAV